MSGTKAMRALRLGLGAAALLALCALLAACGGSGDGTGASGAATAASGGSPAGTSDVAAAKKIADAAQRGSVLGPAAGAIDPTQLRPATGAAIKAFPYKPGGPPKSVVMVACAPNAATCPHEAGLMKSTFDILGIRSRVITS